MSSNTNLYHDELESNLCAGFILWSVFELKEINQMTEVVLTSSEEMIKLPG